jgi:hypothetical protein
MAGLVAGLVAGMMAVVPTPLEAEALRLMLMM